MSEMELFENFDPSAKLWIYQSNREISNQEQEFIKAELNTFLSGWNAHGKALTADYKIYKNKFVLIAVDEIKANATGCSIDSSVKKMKAIGQTIDLDFFNRLNVIVEKDGEQKTIHYNDKDQFKGWNIYDNTITKVSELKDNWLVDIV